MFSQKLAIKYVQNGVYILDAQKKVTDKMSQIGPYTAQGSIYKLPIDNVKLNSGTAFCSMIYCSNDILLAENTNTAVFGEDMHIPDNVLKEFNENVKSHFAVEEYSMWIKDKLEAQGPGAPLIACN